MLLNNGEYSEAVLRFEELAAYKDSCKLRIKALAHIDLRNAVISFYQNFSDAVSMAAKSYFCIYRYSCPGNFLGHL